MKLFILMRTIDDAGNVEDWRGTFDVQMAGVANAKGLAERIRTLITRELVRRGLIAPVENEVPRP